MQSLIHRHESLQIPLGERRKKSDLGRFSLDLSWTKDVTDSSRSRAYPSPPMSGSPPLPPRLNIDSSDRGQGSHVFGGGPAIYRGLPTPQQEQIDQKVLSHRAYPPFSETVTFPASYRSDHMPTFNVLQNSLQLLPRPSQNNQTRAEYSPHSSQILNSLRQPIYSSSRTLAREQSDFPSPKQQRKTKGHVASACVPCKKAHLRCDAQRPCSRCVSNGKEDCCVDVQHKKRGRPRLRDERDSRYDSLTSGLSSADLIRRPLSFYGPMDHLNSSFVQQRQGAPIHQNTRQNSSMEPPCAYLSLDFSVLKSTKSFGETIGMQSMLNRHFQDMVSPNDKDKLFRLQQIFEEERREREPNYLPPIYLTKYEEERVIQSIGFGTDDIGKSRADRQEMLTFQAPDGQQRTFQVRLSLAKKSSIYFVVALLHIPTVLSSYQSPTSPYARESSNRESQYGYHSSVQGFAQGYNSLSFPSGSSYGDGRLDLSNYRTPSGVSGPNLSYASTNNMAFVQPQLRSDYHTQTSYQVPRSELLQSSQPRQHELQLPPIRDPHQQRDYGKARLDIGDLLDGSNSGRPRG
ncbi:putative c6 zinc finger domain containing protein [Golovinomyces cichoracearum]|uniref:Putative c6 zinc finger domain containing protein n=1 Tax=Golovinomyces cichoracearum TaxID=62708 RepID=A0A420J7Z7_9PEZI|nr:putative c6 zinc finger domain containing protein [Golovinomyces cichoracearum]